MKKMFVFDYDGTFYRSESELIENINLIKKVRKAGHLFVIATGRSYMSFIGEIEKYQMAFDYLILSAGALILDCPNHVIKTYPMDISLVKNVDRMLEPFHAKLINQRFNDDFMYAETISTLSQILKVDYTFQKGEHNQEIQEAIDACTKDTFRTYVVEGREVDYIEIISGKTNKGQAILDLLAYLNEDYEVVAVGDSENDIEMLIEFDGYLMQNHDKGLDDYKLRKIDSVASVIKKELA